MRAYVKKSSYTTTTEWTCIYIFFFNFLDQKIKGILRAASRIVAYVPFINARLLGVKGVMSAFEKYLPCDNAQSGLQQLQQLHQGNKKGVVDKRRKACVFGLWAFDFVGIQCVAVGCGMLQCVATCCNLLQCVAV